ncbi:hypothetical protein [Humibacter ginsengisoli]
MNAPEPLAPVGGGARHTPEASSSKPKPQVKGRVLQLFPASLFVVAPYFGFIIPIAIIESNPKLSFLLGLLALALLGTFAAETLLLPLRLRRTSGVLATAPRSTALKVTTVAVIAVAALARIAFVASGGGSLLSQLTGQQRSAFTSVAGLFASWNLFAVGLLFACAMQGIYPKRVAWLGTLMLALIELWGALQTTVTAPLVQFVTAVLLFALLMGFVRLRTLAIALLLVLLAWPTLFSLRNALRVEVGASVDKSVSAWDRLRFDEQLTAVAQFNVPVNAGQLDAFQVIRYGIVPRVLDPGRPDISSARLINQILGGSSTSSFNFLSIGTLYFFYGPIAIVVFYFVAAVVFCLLVSRAVRAGPIALCMVVLAASLLFGWSSTFPDTVVGYLQALVSFVPILVVLLAFRPRAQRPGPSLD